MLKFWILLALLLHCFITCNGIINKVITRALDISSQVTKMGTRVYFENNGPSPINRYNYYVDEDVDYFSITFYEEASKGRRIFEHEKQTSRKKHKYVVNLHQYVPVNASFVFEVSCAIYNKINLLALEENKTRLAKYTSNLYYYSQYPTEQFYDIIVLNRSKIVEYTHHNRFEIQETEMRSALLNFKPFTYDEMMIIYETNIQFYRITKLERTVIISHWHKIYIKDEVYVTNVGSPLKSFGLYHNERNKYKLSTYVPDTAKDIELYDDLGSIFNLEIIYEEKGYYKDGRYQEGRFKLIFEPRFPLLRSYKAHYVLQYTLPTSAHISYRDENFQTELHILNYLLPDAIIENATVRIVLPEGAETGVKFFNPMFVYQRTELYDTMLSFKRNAYVFTTSYVSQSDVHIIALRYAYEHENLWVPVIILSLYLWAFNLSVVLLKRLCIEYNIHILRSS